MAPPWKSRPTLQEVADLAKVSAMTVCRVIHNTGPVSAATRERVRSSIRKLQYRPDPVLSALAAYRSKGGGLARGSVIAFLDCDGSDYSQVVLDGASKEAKLLGYGIESFRLKPEVHFQKRMSRLLFSRGIRGIMFGPSDLAWRFAGWNWNHFVPVSLGAIQHQPAMNAVCVDYFHSAVSAVKYLRQAGCRRLALVVSPRLQRRTADRWLGGFTSMLLNNDGYVYHQENFGNELYQWIKKRDPDGIITIHRGVWEGLLGLKKKFFFLNAVGCPEGVCHISLDARRIGLEGVRLVHHQILRRDFGISAEAKTLTLQGKILKK